MASNLGPSRISTNGLILYLDALNSKSYPSSGTTWFDLSGNGNHFTLINGVVYDQSGFFYGDGTNDYAQSTSSLNLSSTNGITVISVFRTPTTSSGGVLYEYTPDFNNNAGGFVVGLNADGVSISPNNIFAGVRGNVERSITNAKIEDISKFGIATITHDFSVSSDETTAFYNGSYVSKASTPSVLINGNTIFNNNNTGNFTNSTLFLWSRNGTIGFTTARLAALLIYNRVLPYSEIVSSYEVLRERFGLNTGFVTDPDANEFLRITAISGSTQQRAINELVVDLKNAGLWSKMKAVYPFVGGTASTHRFNLKDPRDTNAAFRLVFSGGWTHSATGADPNGTNAWADTFCAHNTMAQNSIHASGYYGDNIASSAGPALGQDGLPVSVTVIYPNYLNEIWTTATGTGGSYIRQSITDARAMVLTYRTSSTVQKQKRNDETPITQNHNSVAPGTQNFIIGAGSFSNVKYYNDAQYRFCTIGDGLTDSEAANLYTIVQKYQTTLGRQV